MPTDSDEPVFDDDFVKGAAFTEPSAQERFHRPGRLERSRARWAGRRRRRTRAGGGSRREYREPSHRRAVVQVIAGVMVLLLISTGLWWLNRPSPQDGGASAIAPAPTGAPPQPPQGDPFAGSPAAGYTDGEAGLQMPDPKAMNGLSEADMALAYVRVRKMLIAANLDPATVYQRRPDALAKLLDPAQRRDFTRDLDRKGEHNSRDWMTSFAAGTAEPALGTVKVHGTVAASKSRDQGTAGVRVTADHLFVYAVRRPGRPETVMREVVRRVTEVFVYREDGAVKLWITKSDRSSAPSSCSADDGFVHPVYPSDPGGGMPNGQAQDPYDQSAPIQADRGCEPVTRV
ncbi:hypothetical protein [Actinomadura rubrisoli]|uniref:Uncharacterized protein n=1 Tax=Actinomadura rubrisoli TaxID=2530368 RepID=A0A4R5B2Q8_9ACTN|nr:hypothetical protein [Actinomadura rubrisoli]TDD77844.1 hypothetical protein E1298_29440 [Actinomadura rubrisoli]